MDWLSLLLPLAYLTILLTSLWTFSHLYRRRQAAKALSLTPWFPTHPTRTLYLSLLELQSSSTASKVPDTVLRAALLRRATADIHRLLSLRNSKPALAQLLQRGSVGDELWQRFQIAEKEMEAELREVVEEANALAQGWGQTIFQSASECAHNEVIRRKLKEVEEKREGEREAWARRRESVREGFLKELEGEAGAAEAKSAVTQKTQEDAVTSPPKTGSSDDDAVLVEHETITSAPDTPGGGSAKKKKAKK